MELVKKPNKDLIKQPPQIKLVDDAEVAKYNVRDLAKEARKLADFSHIDSLASPSELAARAAEIRKELEKADDEQLSQKLRQAKLKFEIEGLETLIANKYTGTIADLKGLFSHAFERKRNELLEDLENKKNTIKVLAVINGDTGVLPTGLELPPLTEVENIKRDVDILIKWRDELEDRTERSRSLDAGEPLESHTRWMGKRDDHMAKIKESLSFRLGKDKSFSTDDYFEFVEIELEVVRESIAKLYHKMEEYLSGETQDKDYSQMPDSEILNVIKERQRKDVLHENKQYVSRVSGGVRSKISSRELEMSINVFAEAENRFLEKKVLEFIEANKERVGEIIDTSIFLEVQTHLAEIDPKDPKVSLEADNQRDLTEAAKMRVVYAALQNFGLFDSAGHEVASIKIFQDLESMILEKLGDDDFPKTLRSIVEKCYGVNWENGRQVIEYFSGNSSSIKVSSEGVTCANSFESNENDENHRILKYNTNGVTGEVNGASNLESWWPHPLGIVVKDMQGNLLLNGKELFDSYSKARRGIVYYSNSRYGIVSTPLGIMWTDGRKNIYVNDKIVGKEPEVAPGQPSQFVGISKRGVVDYRQLAGLGEKYRKAAGVYINGEQVDNNFDFRDVKAVISKDFDFAASVANSDGTNKRILLDGKYQIETVANTAVRDWWVHPRGIVVMSVKNDVRFYSFEAVKEQIMASKKEEEEYNKREDAWDKIGEMYGRVAEGKVPKVTIDNHGELLREIKYKIMDDYVRKGNKIPAKEELDKLAEDMIKEIYLARE